MAAGSLALAFLAGLLSILSPCVLPLLPLVLGAAASESRFGPLALGAGVAVSFVAVGLFVATVGYTIGLDGDAFRITAAILLIGIGTVLVAPPLQARLAVAGGPISNWADQRIDAIRSQGVAAQFGIGLLLGAVWSPCVGPTLGAASLLASEGRSLGAVSLTMLAFGIGAAIPLIAAGVVSRQALARWRNTLLVGGKGAKAALGLIMVAVGVLIVTGFDKTAETALVAAAPDWLTTLTTRF